MKYLKIIVLFLLTACSTSDKGEADSKKYKPVSKELFDSIVKMDSVLFNAFNTCKIEAFTNLLTEDVEFFHDESGLMVSSKTQSDGLKMRCAEQDKNGVLRRELVKESVEVYPIANYGAIQTGAHHFFRTLPGQKEKLTTVAKFMNIWKNTNGEWKISKIFSYAHEGVK